MKKSEIDDLKILQFQINMQNLISSGLQTAYENEMDDIYELAYFTGSSVASCYFDALNITSTDESVINRFFEKIGSKVVQGFLDKVHLIMNDPENLVIIDEKN